MSNFKLDSSHDIIIGRGATRVGGMSDEYIAQLVKCRLLFALNTWALDLNLGLPWLQSLLVKDVENSLFQALINETITSTPGVAGVDSLSLQNNHETRTMNIRFRATTINKSQISEEVIT